MANRNHRKGRKLYAIEAVAPRTDLDEVLPKEKKHGPRWEACKAAVIPQAFEYSVGLHPSTARERITISSQAFAKMTQDPEFRADFEKALGEAPDPTSGEAGDRIVKDGVENFLKITKPGWSICALWRKANDLPRGILLFSRAERQ